MTRNTICVDANFVVSVVTSISIDRVTALWNQWQREQCAIVAPTLISYEMVNVFHRSVTAGLFSQEEGTQFLDNALSLGIQLYGDVELHQQAMQFARQFNLPAAYDAHYLALAQRLEAEFWTLDRKLFNAVHPTLQKINLAV